MNSCSNARIRTKSKPLNQEKKKLHLQHADHARLTFFASPLRVATVQIGIQVEHIKHTQSQRKYTETRSPQIPSARDRYISILLLYSASRRKKPPFSSYVTHSRFSKNHSYMC